VASKNLRRIPLEIPPGIYRNGTRYQSKGRWYDGNGVRFIDATIRPIGGWLRAVDDAGASYAALTGVPRGAIAWRNANRDISLGVGTHSNLYAIYGGVLHVVTPVGFVAGRADSTYATATGNFGAGPYGTGLYGSGSVASSLLEADTWSLDSFGDYLVGACTSDSKLYVWTGTVAVAALAAGSPTCVGVVVTPERFLVALGANGDSRSVAWASQETSTVWVPAITNTAGDFPLTTQGRIMCGKRAVSETLIWTDVDFHKMVYIGGTLVYRFAQVGDKCGIVSKRAAAVLGTNAYWMGHKNFHVYDGYVKTLACEVRDYVFSDFNETQSAKVWCETISEFGEIRWYYCSAASNEIDRYVTYNRLENHWTIGQLSRTAGFDAGPTPNPVEITADGLIYEHELLSDRGSLVPYLESGAVEIGNGDTLMSVQEIVPDENTLGDVSATFYAAFNPTDAETVYGPFTLSAPTGLRMIARQVRVRLDEARQKSWRVGTMRFGVKPSSVR